MRLVAFWGVLVGSVAAICMSLPSVARACGPSKWYLSSGPIACIAISRGSEEGTFAIANDCDDLVVLGKHELDGGTSLHLKIEPGGVGHLALPQSTESNEQVVYDYRVGEEQGEIRFTFEHNPCPSEEGCALPRKRPQSNAGGLSGWRCARYLSF
jgi:hypothetical protein